VTERLGQRISLIDLATGKVSTVADEAINPMTRERLHLFAPSGIYVDNDETIYVADSGGQKIIKISADRSQYWVLAGTGGKGFTARPVPGQEATFNFPEGIWKRGNEIFVADLFNKRIRKVLLPGAPSEGGEVKYFSPPGDYSTLVKKEDGTFERTLKDGTKLFYDENGYLTRKLHMNGRSLTYTYDDEGRLTERVNSFGVKATLAYGSGGKLEAIRDAAGRETRVEIDAKGDLVRVLRPDGAVLDFNYDDRHLLTQRTDERGYWKRYLYNAIGMVAGTEDAMGVKENFTHSLLSNLLSKNITGDFQTPAVLPSLDQENRVVDQRGREWIKKTDERGYTTESMDPLGRVTVYEIGCECGAPSKITYSNGAVYQSEYDDEGRMLSSTDPVGAKTTFTYDSVTSKITSITNARGYTTTFSHDNAGNLTGTTDPLGKTTTIGYNDISLPVSVTDALGNSLQIAYDPYGRIAKTTDQLGYSTLYSYDGAGNLTTITDALGQSTSYAYDPLGRVIAITDAEGYTSTFTYAPGGDLASVTDASGNRTTFSYDLKGRLIQETDPLGKIKTYMYDEDGNLLSATNRRGLKVQYTYDSMKRLIRKFTPERTVEYNYDSLDQLTRIGQVSFAYDFAGRLSQFSDSAGFFSFTYDLLGNLTEVRDGASEQPTQWYYYDALNRIQEKGMGEEVFRFSYDDLGRKRRVTYGDLNIYSGRMKANYTYNARGELIDLAYDTPSIRFSYEYDANGRRTSLTDGYGKHEFSYDSSGQLRAAKWKGMGVERFGYDGSGNMLYNREYDFDYGPGNRLLGDTCGRLRFAYDDDGNMIEKETPEGVTRYQWDSEGRLVRVTRPTGGIITYEYDDLGRKVKKSIGSSTWEWKYLGEDVIEENGPSGRRTYAHGPGIDEPLSMNGRKYFIADGLGSVRKIYGEEGEYRYAAYGTIVSQERDHLNTFSFTGREWDPDAGLYYYRARWYDPEIDRFISEDPIGFAGGLNSYIYSRNDPINWTDPYGFIALYGGIGAGVGAGKNLNPKDGDPLTYFSVSGTRYIGSTRCGGGEEGLLFSAGAGRIVGLALGMGPFAGVNFGNVEDLSGRSSAVGVVYGPVSLEMTFDLANNPTGFNFGFLNRGLGLGVYAQEVGSVKGAISSAPPLEGRIQ
jgi:RHS repeat-associated protein